MSKSVFVCDTSKLERSNFEAHRLFQSVYAACDAIRPMGYGMKKEPDGGSMKGLAFALDPDGYPIEVRKW